MAVRALHNGPERSRDEQFVGRCRELAVLHAQLGRVCEGRSSLVVLEGPAGIGKTALAGEFLAAIENAIVLDVSGEEGEAELPYGVLGQLGAQAQPVPEVLARLPGPGAPAQPDPLVVGAALLELLGQLQRTAPVVIAIDGAGWADLPSLHALTFALRRLRTDRVLAILIARESDDPRLPDGLRRLLRSSAALRLPLSGLSTRELQALSARLGPVRLTPQAAERLHEHTNGVPLHARALLQQVRAETLADVDAPLPAPRAYTTLVLDRLGRCGTAAQRLMTAAAVLGTSAPVHLVARMAELAEPLPALEQATGAGLLVEWRTGAGVSLGFPNPLVRAAIYHDLGPATRRRLHLLAADLADDVVHRLHHRLAAADQVDEELVREVARIGRRQATAGRWSSACGCLTRAVQLTGEGSARDRLIAEAVEALLAAGRPLDAGALAAQVAPAADPAVRDYALGSVALVAGRLEEAVRQLGNAWSHAACDPRLAAGIAGRQAMASLLHGDGPAAVQWAERATTGTPSPPQPPPSGDQISDGARASGAESSGGGELVRFARLVGLGLAGKVEEGLGASGELPTPAQGAPGELDALLGRGMLRLWADDLAGAHDDLLGVLTVSAEGSAPFQLLVATALAQAEYRLGRWDEAAAHAEIGASTADDFGQVWLASYAHAVAALVPAARGEWERALTHVRAARAACHPDNLPAQVSTAGADALTATARGDHEAAITALMPLTRTDLPGEPSIVLWRTLLADALVNAGRLEEAEAVLVPCELLALERERRSALAAVARARAGLLAARHEPVEAESSYQVALGHSAKIDMPFEEARIQLAYGTFLRRRGRRAAAAEQLEAAQLTLSRLGALPYLEQCDLELAASGRAVLRPQDTASLGLTPQEHTVAVLISKGLTNRQAARKLVLSVKTVEYHLSHIYTKLGITSRTALIGRLGDLGE
ncbi:helix-turn-helix transcriptional regulator [Nonomuraea basaltis]|uniref:helix-turn-helix transcriptional regulator n=1 Tax=Nonomuraea basaltis TaxID=2495887 RepID=UPI00110C563C|nr:LuxR family transcriptional regulator [Nonomuraea basaltis]TMR95944.1 helix-turn-helix transcriptional regulator [Nonomuraea basaltis]